MSGHTEKFECKNCKKTFGRKIERSEAVITTKGHCCYLLDKRTVSTYHLVCPFCNGDRIKKAEVV